MCLFDRRGIEGLIIEIIVGFPVCAKILQIPDNQLSEKITIWCNIVCEAQDDTQKTLEEREKIENRCIPAVDLAINFLLLPESSLRE